MTALILYIGVRLLVVKGKAFRPGTKNEGTG